MTYRINGQGNFMSYHAGVWTKLPPREAARLLFSKKVRAQITLYTVLLVIGLTPLAAVLT